MPHTPAAPRRRPFARPRLAAAVVAAAFVLPLPAAGQDPLVVDSSLGTSPMTLGNGQSHSYPWVNVGAGGIGFLTIENSTRLSTSLNSTLGYWPGSTGVVEVTGAGSQWQSGGGFLIGYEGTGMLIIVNGGWVFGNDSVQLGGTNLDIAPSGEGHVLVSGNGSELIVSGELGVGSLGSGNLVIDDGGRVTSQWAIVGSGTEGTAVIHGPGSQWSVGSTGMFLGGSDVEMGGTADVQVRLGGHLDVDGPLKMWNDATLTLDGGSITAASFDRGLGTFQHYHGTLSVNGGAYTQPAGPLHIDGNSSNALPVLELTAGASTTGIGELRVGNARHGGLLVSGGSAVDNGNGIIGHFANSEGIVVVTGSGSQWNSAGWLEVGSAGAGQLIIADGGRVTSAGGGDGSYIATFVGSTGFVEVSGAGAVWADGSNFVSLGNRGLAAMVVSDGGQVSHFRGYVAHWETAQASITISGANSQWISGENLYLGGGAGDASNTHTVGGTANVLATDNGHIAVAGLLKLWNNATLTLDGGSITTGSFDRSVGTFQHHDGVLTVSGGVYTQAAGSLHIDGNAAGALPTFHLTNGSTTTGIGQLRVGNQRQGHLLVAGGSTANSSTSFVGYAADSEGTAIVSGNGSRWDVSGAFLSVGELGRGHLFVVDGGRVSSNTVDIGYGSPSEGLAVVVGSGSQLNSTGSHMSVGEFGKGALRIEDGGAVSSNGDSRIASQNNSQGWVHVEGAGSEWNIAGSLYVAGRGAGPGGDGLLTIAGGGLVDVGGSARTWQPGAVHLHPGGMLRVGNGLTNFGLLAGSGVLDGDLIQAGAISPGDSPGTMTVLGNVELLGGGSYFWEINDLSGTAGGLVGWDLLSIEGALTVSATDENPIMLNLISLTGDNQPGLLAGFNPTQSGQSWTIAAADGEILGFSTDAFAVSYDLFANDLAGGSFHVIQSGNSLELVFTRRCSPRGKHWPIRTGGRHEGRL